jgi:hypothetical protein
MNERFRIPPTQMWIEVTPDGVVQELDPRDPPDINTVMGVPLDDIQTMEIYNVPPIDDFMVIDRLVFEIVTKTGERCGLKLQRLHTYDSTVKTYVFSFPEPASIQWGDKGATIIANSFSRHLEHGQRITLTAEGLKED